MEVVGSDEIGTGVKASKPSALAPSGGVCELTESIQSLVRLMLLLKQVDLLLSSYFPLPSR